MLPQLQQPVLLQFPLQQQSTLPQLQQPVLLQFPLQQQSMLPQLQQPLLLQLSLQQQLQQQQQYLLQQQQLLQQQTAAMAQDLLKNNPSLLQQYRALQPSELQKILVQPDLELDLQTAQIKQLHQLLQTSHDLSQPYQQQIGGKLEDYMKNKTKYLTLKNQ